MNFERLWAPWRLEYVTGSEPQEAPPEPLAWLPNADHELLSVPRGGQIRRRVRRPIGSCWWWPAARTTIVVLNRYPYNNGHLLVSPLRHVGDLKDMTRDENVRVHGAAGETDVVYRERLNAEGFNIGLNLGRVAGAGLPGPFALASRAALGRRQQFHAGAGRHARDSAVARRAVGDAASTRLD